MVDGQATSFYYNSITTKSQEEVTIKQVMEWLRTALSKMLSKLTDFLPGRQSAPPPPVDKALDRKLGRDIQERRERGVGRLLNTRHGGSNMPKYQPCDICLKWVKRVEKTSIGRSQGAKYHCNKCNNDIYELAR